MKKIWQFIPQVIICLLAIVLINTGNAWGVSILVGSGGAEVFTKLENCSEYDRLSSSYVSVYRNAAGFTASSHTYANDFEYFKQAYCGQEKINNNQIQAAECYKIDYNGTPKGKVVVADCAPSSSYAAKMYFYMAGGTISTGVNTTKPTTYNAALEFVAQCGTCSGSDNIGNWTASGTTGYQQRTRASYGAIMCNICGYGKPEYEYRCANNWFGTSTDGKTGCSQCPTGTNVNVSSTAGQNTNPTNCKYTCKANTYGAPTYGNTTCTACPTGTNVIPTGPANGQTGTTVASCTYKCASGYYGTATNATTGCTKCPENATCAGENGSTFVCNSGYYNAGATYGECYACADVKNYSTGVAVCDNTGIKCKAGYYGTRTGPGAPILESCTRCPHYGQGYMETLGTCYNVTSEEGSIGIESCYIKAGACQWTDDIGTFVFDENCEYDEHK